MTLAQQILDELGYLNSPNFLCPGRRNRFEGAADFSHIFRRARQHCRLHGVYSLRESESKARDTIIPVVYVCEAEDEADAERIHRLVWNQNVVPFLIVASQQSIRLYSGFRYEPLRPNTDPVAAGIIQAANEMSAALQFLDAFRSRRIDDGTLWERWGDQVTPETRVDWKLLSSLNNLDNWLQSNGLDNPRVSHALIGKYVYLQYLRHRSILSDRKLDKWGLEETQIFGRRAQVSAFWQVVQELDNWLNGSVFPLQSSGAGRPKQEHIRKVAGTFAGDDPASGQLSLDFDAYDFSFIPIETLSVIYEQFLHAPEDKADATRGRTQGAYYTPIPLVNFMLEELDALHPFKEGMRVLDPACGSGAFLVQWYRRIIEQDDEFQPGRPMRPARLRELLERHIFGIDRDEDACRVAELSLSLTLLDYVDPPDLERTPRFRLPELHGTNVFHGDFFDPEAQWRDDLPVDTFDWIVGNPPWVELKSGKISEEDRFVWGWMQDSGNQRNRPTGGNQIAEAFAWEVTEQLSESGCVALLLPAMTLFKDESREFRKSFFESRHVYAVANFANLAEVLFPGHRYREGKRTTVSRPRRPAAAFFYAKKQNKRPTAVSVYSPLVADQPANRPPRPGDRKDTWNIVVDSSQIRSLELRQISAGDALPWKAAMWGSHLDIRLVQSIAKRFLTLTDFARSNGLICSRGLELRSESAAEELEYIPEVTGKPLPVFTRLPRREIVFEFPDEALEVIPKDRSYVRKGRGPLPLSVCRPPHIIIHESGRFAVYSDEFMVVPAGQFGIWGPESREDLLKALSLYLISDFSIYHQFLTSPQWGISTSVSTLQTLRSLPIPLSGLTNRELAYWSHLHSRIIAATRDKSDDQPPLFGEGPSARSSLSSLVTEMNEAVYELLQLRDDERLLVEDLVHLRMQLIQGKVSANAVRQVTNDELATYGEALLDELDAFIDDQPRHKHSISIARNSKSAIVGVTLQSGGRQRKRVRVVDFASTPHDFSEIRDRVCDKGSQWIYFRRNLRLYEGRNTYVFKPLERLHWTKSQALLDAGSIIAETLG
jgi:hypothetical protein